MEQQSTAIPLCHISELAPDSVKGVDLPQAGVLVVRKRGGIHVWLNRCPHLRIPLQWQEQQFLDSGGEFLRCSTHGALFEPESGLCIQGPCRGDSLWQIGWHLDNDMIMIDASELPAMPYLRS